jgi:hypothetical protein
MLVSSLMADDDTSIMLIRRADRPILALADGRVVALHFLDYDDNAPPPLRRVRVACPCCAENIRLSWRPDGRLTVEPCDD